MILLAGFGLRMWHLGETSLWADEVYSDLWMKASFDDFMHMLQEDGVHVPLHYLLMRLFPVGSVMMLRFPSALEGLLGIAVMIGLVQRVYGNQRLALVAGALLAFNPYHIWYSRMARTYALLFVFAALASLFFLQLVQGERSRKTWFAFTLSSAAAYMTHYFAVLLPVAQYILFAFVLKRKRRVFRQWLIAQVIAGLPFVLWIVSLAQQESLAVYISWIPRPGIGDVFLTVWNMTVDYEGVTRWYAVAGLIAVGVGLVPGLAGALREHQKNLVSFYWLWLMIIPVGLVFVFSVFVRPLYVDRYFMILLPALLLLVLTGWQRLPHQLGQLAAVIVVLAGAAAVWTAFDQGTFEREAWRDMADTIRQEHQPGDGVLMDTQISLAAFLLYYDDRAILNHTRLFGVPDAGTTGAPVLQEPQEPVTRMWTVYRNPIDDIHREGVMPDFDPFDPRDTPISHWLDERRDRILEQYAFNGVTLFLVDVSGEPVTSEVAP